MHQQQVSTRPPHVDNPPLLIEVIARYIAVNRTNKQPTNSLENHRTKRFSSEMFESATGQLPLVLKSITRHHRQSSLISGGFRGSTNWLVALRVSTNSPFSPCFPAFLQTRRFLHFPAFLQTHRFLNFLRFYKLAVFYISPRFYILSPSHPFPRLYT